MNTNKILTLTFRSGYNIKRAMGFSPDKSSIFTHIKRYRIINFIKKILLILENILVFNEN
jgi:hypothetical protein